MVIDRRRFLKFSGLALAGGIAGSVAVPKPGHAVEVSAAFKNKAMLNDTAKCIGCLSCITACKKANDLPDLYGYSLETNAETWTTVKFKKSENNVLKVKTQCMHCTTPSCTGVCPTGAAYQTAGGVVVLNQDICIGCKNCVVACPFNVPGFSEETGTARKCEFCRQRLEKGLIPACAEACPVEAIEYGDRAELLSKAAKRVGELVKQGYNNAQVYGINQLDGLKVLYVLPDLPENIGLPHAPRLANGDVVLKWAMGILAAGFVALAPLKAIFQDPETIAVHQEGEVKPHDF